MKIETQHEHINMAVLVYMYCNIKGEKYNLGTSVIKICMESFVSIHCTQRGLTIFMFVLLAISNNIVSFPGTFSLSAYWQINHSLSKAEQSKWGFVF